MLLKVTSIPIFFTVLPQDITITAGELFWSCVPQGTQAATMDNSFRTG